MVTTISSDGKVRLYDLAALPLTSDEKTQLEPIAEYDTKGTRLTCLTMAEGDETVPMNGKRKRDDEEMEEEEKAARQRARDEKRQAAEEAKARKQREREEREREREEREREREYRDRERDRGYDREKKSSRGSPYTVAPTVPGGSYAAAPYNPGTYPVASPTGNIARPISP